MKQTVNNTISSSHVTTRFINKSFIYLTKIRIYYTNDAENILNTFVLDSKAFFFWAFITPLSHAFLSLFLFDELFCNKFFKAHFYLIQFYLQVFRNSFLVNSNLFIFDFTLTPIFWINKTLIVSCIINSVKRP